MVNRTADPDRADQLAVVDPAALIHREIARLLVLVGIAVCAFVGTAL